MSLAPVDPVSAALANDTVRRTASRANSSRSAGRVRQRPTASPSSLGAVLGRLAAIDGIGTPLVDYPNNPDGRPIESRATIPLGPDEVGREVVLAFEHSDPRLPIILGVIRGGERSTSSGHARTVQVDADGERVVVTAEKELVLCCGDASITLTRAGKVLIRGAYLLSRSSGVNRIKGGSVQIN
jgi:hypothetical protein